MQNARQVSRRPRSLSNGSANARRVELRGRRRLQPRRREGRLTVAAAPEGVRQRRGREGRRLGGDARKGQEPQAFESEHAMKSTVSVTALRAVHILLRFRSEPGVVPSRSFYVSVPLLPSRPSCCAKVHIYRKTRRSENGIHLFICLGDESENAKLGRSIHLACPS